MILRLAEITLTRTLLCMLINFYVIRVMYLNSQIKYEEYLLKWSPTFTVFLIINVYLIFALKYWIYLSISCILSAFTD